MVSHKRLFVVLSLLGLVICSAVAFRLHRGRSAETPDQELTKEFDEWKAYRTEVHRLREIVLNEEDPAKKNQAGKKLFQMAREEVGALAKDHTSRAFPRLVLLGEFSVSPLVEGLDDDVPEGTKEVYAILLAGVGSRDQEHLALLAEAVKSTRTEEGRRWAKKALHDAQEKLLDAEKAA